MKARFASFAEIELRDAMEFYEAAQNGLGARFLSKVEAAVSCQNDWLGGVFSGSNKL
ncbi:MAG TPA: hypothetical protein VI136_24045 [Verrucomicrobiae bacterium]